MAFLLQTRATSLGGMGFRAAWRPSPGWRSQERRVPDCVANRLLICWNAKDSRWAGSCVMGTFLLTQSAIALALSARSSGRACRFDAVCQENRPPDTDWVRQPGWVTHIGHLFGSGNLVGRPRTRNAMTPMSAPTLTSDRKCARRIMRQAMTVRAKAISIARTMPSFCRRPG